MWCWALQSLRHQHLAAHSRGTHLSEVSSPAYTNSRGSTTASVNKAPLKPAKRKEEAMHASTGAPCFPWCEHLALLSKATPFSLHVTEKEGWDKPACPKPAWLFIQLRCAKPRLLCSHDALHKPGGTDLCLPGTQLFQAPSPDADLPSQTEQRVLGAA